MSTILPGNTGADQVRADFYFKPNLELLNQALATKQKTYDDTLTGMQKVKAKIDEVNTLGKYDTERHAQKQAEYEARINEIQGMYDGDLTKAQNEFQGFLGAVGKDFGKHGEFTALNSRYAGYQANAKDITERRNKGEITKQQAYAMTLELNRTDEIGIGTDKNKWNPWGTVNLTNALDRAKYLSKLTKGWNANHTEKWGPPIKGPTGLLTWYKDGKKMIDESEVRREAIRGLRMELERTGELVHDWNYQKAVMGKKPTMEQYETMVGDAKSKANSIKQRLETLNGLPIKEQQEAINQGFRDLGYAPPIAVDENGEVDGLDGKQTQKYLKLLQGHLNSQQNLALDEVAALTADDVDELGIVEERAKKAYFNHMLSQEVEPYVQKTAYSDIRHDMKIHDDPIYKHEMEMAKLKRSAMYARENIKYAHDIKKEEPIQYGQDVQGMTTDAPYGKTTEEYDEKKGQLTIEAGINNDAFIDQIMDAYPMDALTPEERVAMKAKMKTKFGNHALANGSIVQENGKTFFQKPDGTRIDLPPGLHPSVYVKFQNTARDIQQREAQFVQAKEEAEYSARQDGDWTPEEREYLNLKDDIDKQYNDDVVAAYDLYKAGKLTGAFPRSHADARGLTFGQFKERLKSEFTLKNLGTVAGAAGNTENEALFRKMQKNRKWKEHNAPVEAKLQGKVGEYLGRMEATFSTQADTYGLVADGRTDQLAKRQEFLKDWMGEPANLAGINIVVTGGDGKPDITTISGYLEELGKSSGKKYTYETADVLAEVGKHNLVTSIVLYELDEDGKKTDIQGPSGSFKVANSDLKFDFLQHRQQQKEYRIAAEYAQAAANGLQATPFGAYDPVAKSQFTYKLKPGKKQNNVDQHKNIQDMQVEFVNYPVIQRTPSGHIIYEKAKDASGRTYMKPKTELMSTTMSGAKAEGILFDYYRKDAMRERANNLGIYEKPISRTINGVTGPSSRMEYLAHLDLMNRNQKFLPSRIMSEARKLGLTPHQAMELFNLKEVDSKYVRSKYLTQQELSEPGIVEIFRTN